MRYIIAFLGVDLGTTMFLAVYSTAFFLLLMGALLLAMRVLRQDEAQQSERRLGRSIWLCADCHALYTGATYQCPSGRHATQLFVEASALLVAMGGDEFASESLMAVAGRDAAN